MVVVPSRNPPPPPPPAPARDRRENMPARPMGPHSLSSGTLQASRSSPVDRDMLPHSASSPTSLLQLHQVSLFPPPPGGTGMPDRHGTSPGPAASESDRELWVLYSAVLELSEQLEKNRMVAVELGAQAARLRAQAGHAQAGFPLRRFNLNLSEETYSSELNNMTRALRIQNAELGQDNRALSNLVREHESTLDVVMTKFRTSAHETQQRELALTRNYENALLAKDAQMEQAKLERENRTRAALCRVGANLRHAWRSSLGESPPSPSPSPSALSDDINTDVVRDMADWSLEREIELARLERENAELRRMVGHPVSGYPYALDSPSSPVFPYPLAHSRGGSRKPSRDFVPTMSTLLSGSALSLDSDRDRDGSQDNDGPGSPELGPTARRLRSGPGFGVPSVRVASPFAGTGGAMGIGLRLDVPASGPGLVGPGRRPARANEWEVPWGDASEGGGPVPVLQKRNVSAEIREALLS